MKRILKVTVALCDKEHNIARFLDAAELAATAGGGSSTNPLALFLGTPHDLLNLTIKLDQDEKAALAIKEIGVVAVIAHSFPPRLYRDLVNNAIYPIECGDSVASVKSKDEIEINLDKNEITWRSGLFRFEPVPPLVGKIIECGGLFHYTKKIIGK